MARTPSTMLDLGTAAPDFTLLEPLTGNTISLSDFSGKPLVVLFICNHCPFVKLIAEKLAEVANTYQEKGVAFVAINSNDVANYPDDSPEKMVAFVREYGIGFPYLFDETQAVAKAYRAACTPDIYLFDAAHKLVYRGQFDAARPGNEEPVTGLICLLQTSRLQALAAISSGSPVMNPIITGNAGLNIEKAT